MLRSKRTVSRNPLQNLYDRKFCINCSKEIIFVEKNKRQSSHSIVKSNVAIPFHMIETIEWEKVIKKEARGLDDYDLGEVQEVNDDIIITKKGVVDKDKFFLPRSKALRFEEDKLWFEISKEEARAYKHH
jgi:hypothetical protein